MRKQRVTNNLMVARRQRGLSRKQVSMLLGYDGTSTVARQEQGKLVPTLQTLLKLEILYRTPIAFLYAQLYAILKDEVRTREAASAHDDHAPAAFSLGREGDHAPI